MSAVEITGVSTWNKGAELMLVAIREALHRQQPALALAVEAGFGTYGERAGYGLWTKVRPTKLGRSWLAAKMMPASFRRACGLVNESDISAVLDASGFAFGDQLGAERTEVFAADVARWKRQGKPVVLLPQALGPFESPRLRVAFGRVVRHADLIYARDRVSYRHVESLGLPCHNLRLAPDFTNLVAGELPVGFAPRPRGACIVPNHRMVEKTDAATRDRYIPFLATCVSELTRLGLEPFVLLHDSAVDQTLVEPLCRALGASIPVVRERCPRRLKGILGAVHVVVGSRFHALVGALSQAVPCVASGWSHKYQMLFEDYGCPECVLPVDSTAERVREVLEHVAQEPRRSRLVAQLTEAARRQREQTEKMWVEVDSVLEMTTAPDSQPQRMPSAAVPPCRVEPA